MDGLWKAFAPGVAKPHVLMALEAAEVDVRRYRRPWYWLVVLFVAAVAATALILSNARARIAERDSDFMAHQALRLQRVEQRIADYFSDAAQLAAVGSALLGSAAGDRLLVHDVVLGLYESRRNRNVYGLGVFYEPYAFDPGVRFISFYDHGPLPAGFGTDKPGPYDRFLPGNVKEIAYDSSHDPDPLDYTHFVWYRAAVADPRETVIMGPYDEKCV